MGRSARTALVLCLSLTLTLALPIDTTTAAARLLGVKLPHDLTVSKLRKAYRKAASVSHPDVSGDEDAEAVFVKVTDAYHLLLKNIDNPGKNKSPSSTTTKTTTRTYTHDRIIQDTQPDHHAIHHTCIP